LISSVPWHFTQLLLKMGRTSLEKLTLEGVSGESAASGVSVEDTVGTTTVCVGGSMTGVVVAGIAAG
jgi:hypothetical protein